MADVFMPPDLGALLQEHAAMQPTPERPSVDDGQQPMERVLGVQPYVGRTAYRDSAAAGNLTPWITEQPQGITPLEVPRPETAKHPLLEGGTTDALAKLGIQGEERQLHAGRVVGALGQKVAMSDRNIADPDGAAGARWELAGIAKAHDAGWIKDDRFNELYGQFRHGSMAPEDQAELANLMAQVAEATRWISDPDLDAGEDIKITGLSFDPGGYAVPVLEVGKLTGAIVREASATPLPAMSIKGNVVATPAGLVVVGDDRDDELDRQARVLYPATPTTDAGHKQRWLKRRPEASYDHNREIARRLTAGAANGDPVQVEVHLPMSEDPVNVPGNHLVVLSGDPVTTRKLQRYAAKRELEAKKLPPVEIQGTTVPELDMDDEDVEAPPAGVAARGSDVMWLRLPDELEDTHAVVQAVLAAGGTRPILYTHEAPGEGFAQVREHRYVDPSGFTVLTRSRSTDHESPHSYPAWMLTPDADELPAEVDTKVGGQPKRLPGGAATVDGQVTVRFGHLEGDSAEISNTLTESVVGGKRTRHLVIDGSPYRPYEVSLGTDEATARAGGVKGVYAKVNDESLELTVPVAGGGLDLTALAETIWFLKRYGGKPRFDNLRITGTDGRTYDFNGQVAK